MKKYPFIILLVVVIAAIASLYAIPDTQEIALNKFRDKNFEDARNLYEAQLQQGDLSPEVAKNLVDLYLQDGRVDDAVEVMERFVEKKPSDITARVILGQLYQYAQRQDDYLRNLEEIKAMNPSEAVLARLHEEYQKGGEFDKQRVTLEALAEQGAGGDAARYRNLARLQAESQRWDEAVASLRKVRELDANGFNFGEVELLTSLLCDAGQPVQALDEAKGWTASPAATPQQLARLANILHYKASANTAMNFFAAISNRIQEAPELLNEYVLAMIGVGQTEQAYKLMKDLYANNQLPVGLQREMLFQAVAANDMEMVHALYQQVDVSQFNESQLITLAELAILQKQPELLAPLKERFATEEGLQKYPLFALVVGLAEKAPDVDARIERVKALPLNTQQRLLAARACARSGKQGCVRDLVDQIDNVASLSDVEKADVAELYLLAKDYGRGKAFVEQARAASNSPALDVAWAKFAAATGDARALESWLDAKADLGEDDFKSLYFLANDNGQKATSLMVAERLYARYQTDEVRNFLVTAYISNKQYAKALPMLKAVANRTQADEDNYFFVLVNLAKQDPKYRGELTEYAATHLKNAKTERQRLAMVYTLVEAGRSDVALPFIKEYASKQGGQWIDVYASSLDKKGMLQEARDFRMEIATKPYTSPEVKRQIAYTLLNQGFKDDAASLFYDLASRPDAQRKDAEQLLYLWGPRLSAEQVNWVAGRALASNDQNYDFWVERLTVQSGAEELVAFVQSQPEALNEPRIATKYVQSLSALGYLDDAQSAQAKNILNSKNPQMLREFAAAARANSKTRPARAAYETIAAIEPGNAEALRNAGLIAFSQADYNASEQHLDNYFTAVQQGARDTNEAYLAYFYKAEILRKNGKAADAKSYYQACVDTVLKNPQRTKEMQSKAVQSMILAGNVDSGIASFQELMQQYPQDAGIRADFAATLIEMKRYEEAQQLLSVDVDSLNPSAGIAPISIPVSELEGYRFFSGGQELLLKLRSPQLRTALANPALKQQFNWLGYITEGDDRVLIVAKPGVELALAPTGDSYDIFPQMQTQMSANDAARQMRLRYELLQARIDVETGKSGSAVARLNNLQPYYPNDPQLLGFTANAENYAGRWKRALALLDEAQRISPENQDIAKLRRDVWLAHAPHVKLDHEWLSIGDSDQQVTTLSGRADITQETDISWMVQNNHIKADGIRRPDGRVGNFKDDKQRAEIVVRHDLDESNQVRGAVYANNNTLGVGAGYSFLNALGETDLFIDYHRPTFDFYEGVFDDAVRDRIGIGHTYKPNTRTVLSGVLALNNYSVEQKNNVAKSISFNGQILYQLLEGAANPSLAAIYGLDLEHRLDAEQRTDGTGVDYLMFPMRSREVHTVALASGYDFNEQTHADLLAGYSVDRYTGHGPLVEGRLTHRMIEDQLEAQIRAGYGMRTANSLGDVTRVGGYLMWRY
jgi:protein involved in temperature-dependent protein secretion